MDLLAVIGAETVAVMEGGARQSESLQLCIVARMPTIPDKPPKLTIIASASMTHVRYERYLVLLKRHILVFLNKNQRRVRELQR